MVQLGGLWGGFWSGGIPGHAGGGLRGRNKGLKRAIREKMRKNRVFSHRISLCFFTLFSQYDVGTASPSPRTHRILASARA